eukprot:10900899-Lingulodinium_polyedra.AAC.1
MHHAGHWYVARYAVTTSSSCHGLITARCASNVRPARRAGQTAVVYAKPRPPSIMAGVAYG